MSVLTSVSGFPRIGQNRELKKIIEAYWKGVATLDDVRATAKELRAKHWKLQQEAGRAGGSAAVARVKGRFE